MAATSRCAPHAHVGPLVLRRRTLDVAQRQCDACGCGSGPRERVAFMSDERVRSLPFWVRKRAKPRPNSRRREYERFLHSPEWRIQRARILIRDNFTCRSCDNEATSVHHIKYSKILAETPDSDLVSACEDCQQAERSLRGLLR